MLGQGNRSNDCMPSSPMVNKEDELNRAERYSRCIFQDMQTAIGLMKVFSDQLSSLHPDVIYKIRNLL